MADCQTGDLVVNKSEKLQGNRWTTPEELTLIDLVLAKEDDLFGSLKGPVSSATARTEQRRAEIWAHITDTLNCRFTHTKREVDKVKKKFHNCKQRAKEKIDIARRERRKTGGGAPPPQPTPAEEALLNTCSERPSMCGLDGIDTDDYISTVPQPGTSTDCMSQSCAIDQNDVLGSSIKRQNTTAEQINDEHKPTKRKLSAVDKATLENIALDNKRLRGELVLQELQKTLYKTQSEAYENLKTYLLLKMNQEFSVTLLAED